MTGIRSQRGMKRGLRQPPVFSELRLFSREAITRFERQSGILSVIRMFRQSAEGPTSLPCPRNRPRDYLYDIHIMARTHYVESGQIASLSCWLAAAAPTAWVSRPHSGLLRPECQAGFRSHLRSCYKHGFALRGRHDGGVDTLLPMRVECLHL